MGSRTIIRRPAWAVLLLVVLSAALFYLTSSARERELLAVNTLYLAGWTCAISLPLGTYLAVALARTDLPCRRVFAVLVVVAMFLPLYTQTAAWQAGFGQQGWAYHWLDRWPGAIWIHSMAAVPWVSVIVGIALVHVEPQLEESALLHGSQWRTLWSVTLRRSWFAVLAAGIWVGILTSGEFTVTDMWGLRTYAEDLFRGFAVGETPEETAFGMLPSVAAAALVLLAALVALGSFLRNFEVPKRPPRTYRLGWWRWPQFACVLLLLVCLIGVPVLNLLMQLGISVEQLPDETYQRTWQAIHAIEMLGYSLWEFRREVGWSLLTSTVAATIAMAVAIPLAWLARDGSWRAWPMMFFAALLFALPGPLLGLLLIWSFNGPNWAWLNFLYDRSILAPTAALTLRALPLVMIIAWYVLRSISQKTLDAAALDGAGTWRQLVLIALPQRVIPLIAAWLVGLAIAIGDLSASFLVLPPGTSPISRRIFEEVHYGVPDRVAGITLVTMLLTSAIVLATVALFAWYRQARPSSAW